MATTQNTPIVEHAGSGYKMPEPWARRIDELAKGLPNDFHYKRVVHNPVEPKFGTLEDGARTDLSMITTDDVDRDKEVVLPGGLDLSDFRKSPTVFYAHDYTKPVGKSLWQKPEGNGIAALTRYAKKPEGWQGPWLPDAVHSMAQEGIGGSKSIGFMPLNARNPTPEEMRRRPEWMKAERVIDRAMLFEYSCAPLACNQNAIQLAVSKGIVGAENAYDLFGVKPEETKAMADATETPHSRSSTQFDLPDHAAAAMKAMAARVADDDLADDGREAEPHLTLHYGLHATDPEDVRKAVDGMGPVTFKLGAVNHFPADESRASDVLHVEAVGQGLHALKKRLTALPHSNTHATYQPHVTLAYCKPGAAAKYKGMDGVEGMTLTCRSLTFSDPAGKKTAIPLGEQKAMEAPETKTMGESSEAGDVVPDADDKAMPACPTCKSAAGVAAKPDAVGAYNCAACGEEFKNEDCGDMEEKQAPAVETKAVPPPVPTVNAACATRVRRLIADGSVSKGEWSAPGDNATDDCLGSAKSFPVIKGGEVYARAVAAACEDPAPSVAAEAKKLMRLIQAHEGKTFVRPETIRASARKTLDALTPEIIRVVREEFREGLDRARGRV